MKEVQGELNVLMRSIVKSSSRATKITRCHPHPFSTKTVHENALNSSALKEISGLWDLDKYPIEVTNDGMSIRPSMWLKEARRDLIQKNYILLPNLVPTPGIHHLLDEVGMLPQSTHYTSSMTHNILLEEEGGDQSIDQKRKSISLSEEEVKAKNELSQLKQDSRKTLLAYDNFHDGSPLRQLYNSEILRQLVSFVLTPPGAEELMHIYPSADHMGAAYLNIFDKGDQLGWHFDRSQFFVNLVLQSAPSGGDFQFAWDSNSCQGPSYDSLKEVVMGENESNLHTLSPQPGTLMVFAGNRAMHRVTPVQSSKPRINVILTFESTANAVLNDYTRQKFFGRTQ